VLVIWIVLLLFACTGPQSLTPERLAGELEPLVRAHPGWRLGSPTDCRTEQCARYRRENPGYHPYRFIGDVNNDGLEDAVVVLFNADSSLIYWLPGDGRHLGTPQRIGALNWAFEGGLFHAPGRLSFGVFYSDVVFDWKWESGRKQLVQLPPDTTSDP
jgi:hypothetical protein